MTILAFPRTALRAQLSESAVPFSVSETPTEWVLRPRIDLETDPNFLQLIPYGLLRRADGTVWTYRRIGGDGRLRGQKSVGVGGHVDAADVRESLLETARSALVRELTEELRYPPPQIPKTPLGWINEQASAVGRVHLGLVWDLPWKEGSDPEPVKGEALAGNGFVPTSEVSETAGFERWSVLACRLAKTVIDASSQCPTTS